MQGIRNKIGKNAFYKHWKNMHEVPDEKASCRLDNFKFRVDKTFQEPMLRQINEMVRMSTFTGTLLNSKAGWNAPPIVRIIAVNESEKAKAEERNQIASQHINSVQVERQGLMRAHSS